MTWISIILGTNCFLDMKINPRQTEREEFKIPGRRNNKDLILNVSAKPSRSVQQLPDGSLVPKKVGAYFCNQKKLKSAFTLFKTSFIFATPAESPGVFVAVYGQASS